MDRAARRGTPGKGHGMSDTMTNAELIARQNRVQSPVEKALRRAFSLGQTYWQQADSESYVQNRRSDETHAKFEALVAEMIAEPTHQGAASLSGAQQGEVMEFTTDDDGLNALLRTVSAMTLGHCNHDVGALFSDELEDVLRRLKSQVDAPTQPAPGGEDRMELVAYVPIHPRSGPLWQETFSAAIDPTESRPQSYPTMPLFAAMSPPPTSGTSRPFTPEEHAAWERENGVGTSAKGEGELG